MVTTTYEKISRLKKLGIFGELVTCGLIDKKFVNYCYIYETYINFRQLTGETKKKCYEMTGVHCHKSPNRVRAIVDIMSK